ncbi:fimbrial protein [Yersinia enterocolitica]|uniref:fimbrial protein n=1 Tax=Yersinia enterocolitica TaxID=630 RepID=UPI00227A4B5C|nr:fimbrial protein [Yersinia enterocolitica]MCY1688743.1 fimbrial protein [Yersinia enterocolitica]
MLNKRNVARLVIFFATGLLTNSSIVLAEQVSLTVKLTILAPTCTINDNKAISVNFGEVLTQKVDGKNYIKPVDYSLKCTGSDSQMFNMKIEGTAAQFNDSALKTNITDFGIALLANDKPLKINDSIAFSSAKKPVLQVVPVKVVNKPLIGGDFTANAVMKISYQ